MPPSCNWSGFYFGINGGGVFGNSEMKDVDDYNLDNDKWSYDASGFTKGGQIGYNFQVHSFVFGLEADAGYLGIDGDGTQPASPGGDTFGETSGGFFTTLRARMGVSLMHDKCSLMRRAAELDRTRRVE